MVMQQYMDTLCASQRQINLTTSLLQDIHTFDGWNTTDLEDWLSDIEAAVDNLKECPAHLAKVKSHGLTHTLVKARKTSGISFV